MAIKGLTVVKRKPNGFSKKLTFQVNSSPIKSFVFKFEGIIENVQLENIASVQLYKIVGVLQYLVYDGSQTSFETELNRTYKLVITKTNEALSGFVKFSAINFIQVDEEEINYTIPDSSSKYVFALNKKSRTISVVDLDTDNNGTNVRSIAATLDSVGGHEIQGMVLDTNFNRIICIAYKGVASQFTFSVIDIDDAPVWQFKDLAGTIGASTDVVVSGGFSYVYGAGIFIPTLNQVVFCINVQGIRFQLTDTSIIKLSVGLLHPFTNQGFLGFYNSAVDRVYCGHRNIIESDVKAYGDRIGSGNSMYNLNNSQVLRALYPSGGGITVDDLDFSQQVGSFAPDSYASNIYCEVFAIENHYIDVIGTSYTSSVNSSAIHFYSKDNTNVKASFLYNISNLSAITGVTLYSFTCIESQSLLIAREGSFTATTAGANKLYIFDLSRVTSTKTGTIAEGTGVDEVSVEIIDLSEAGAVNADGYDGVIYRRGNGHIIIS